LNIANDTPPGVKAKSPPTSNDKEGASTLELNAEENRSIVPWTIANKYYTADVHFEAREWKSNSESGTGSRLTLDGADGVPAVIFVWMHGEVCICF
jgi:hypothetical protein